MDRRRFLYLTSLSGLALLAPACRNKHKIPTRIAGATASIGHLLREPKFAAPARTVEKDLAIVGGGVSGLSAARWLRRSGLSNFSLLDLEPDMGGNAAFGRNEVSAFPLGAHYVPTPNNELSEYLDFLREAGVITGYEQGLPVYNEYHLCFDPQERLYINGRWQDGVIPSFGLTAEERRQTEAFLAEMDRYRNLKGSDGKDAFAIPVDRSSTDEVFTSLDRISMKSWMEQQGFNCKPLHWYVNYCTRDDFGTNYEQASAWAGIHYFAGRKGKGANAEHGDVLTWPEGNGFLVKALERGLEEQLQPQCLVTRVALSGTGVDVDYIDLRKQETVRIHCRQCILALPQFVAARILNDDTRLAQVREQLHYAPWMVANLKVRGLTERTGVPLSWDNVLYEGAALGYVNATQQLLQSNPSVRNLTYYLPLTEGEPAEALKQAQVRKPYEWTSMIIRDLQAAHPGLEDGIEEVTVQLWGHAMAQPRPGWIHGGEREALGRSLEGRIHFAHTDLAGISIFEEGFYQGLGAAERVLQNRKEVKP